jgi:hypothetical protein
MASCDINQWINGDWFTCLFDPTVTLIGEPMFGLLIGAAVWTSFYLAGGGSSAAPTVVCILLASIMFPTLPSAYVGIAWSVLLVGAAAAVFQSMQKYVLSPATQ